MLYGLLTNGKEVLLCTPTVTDPDTMNYKILMICLFFKLWIGFNVLYLLSLKLELEASLVKCVNANNLSEDIL